MRNNLFLIVALILLCLSKPIQAKSFQLSPNEVKHLTNPSPWTLNAICTVRSNNKAQSKIKISVLKNHGSVNGKSLNSGHATYLKVKNNSSIKVIAEVGTEINLMNLSNDNLQADCAT